MKPFFVMIALATCSVAAPSFANDDDMMGTMVNGRVELRNERSARVQDPAMDRELMVIDREKRQGRNPVDPNNEDPRFKERLPYEGPLPD